MLSHLIPSSWVLIPGETDASASGLMPCTCGNNSLQVSVWGSQLNKPVAELTYTRLGQSRSHVAEVYHIKPPIVTFPLCHLFLGKSCRGL